MFAIMCATNPLWEFLLFPLLFIAFGAFIGHVFHRITTDSRLATLGMLVDDFDDNALFAIEYDEDTDGLKIVGIESGEIKSKPHPPYNWEEEE
jgi:hypothetical protein